GQARGQLVVAERAGLGAKGIGIDLETEEEVWRGQKVLDHLLDAVVDTAAPKERLLEERDLGVDLVACQRPSPGPLAEMGDDLAHALGPLLGLVDAGVADQYVIAARCLAVGANRTAQRDPIDVEIAIQILLGNVKVVGE